MANLRPWRIVVLILVAGIGLALLGGFFFRDWLAERWRAEEELGDNFPPGVLADYVPEDSEAVVFVHLRSLEQSPLGRQQFAPALKQLLPQGQARLRWLDLLGVRPLEDLDTLLISFAPGGGKEPLWLARGRLDRSRIQLGPDKLQEKLVDGFRVWEYRNVRAKQTTRIAPLGDMFVASDTPERVRMALKQASDPRPVVVRDATLRDLLTKVDRKQTIWLAAAIKRFDANFGIDNFWLRTILHPLLAHAESVYGEINCAEDVRAELHFRAAGTEQADKLEMSLHSICDVAREGSWLVGRQKELLPLLRLIGTGQINREGRTIQLRCRLTAE